MNKTAPLTLAELGWCDFFESQRTPADPASALMARVVEELRGMFRVATEKGVLWAEVSGKLQHEAKARAGLPVTGDWLLIQPDSSFEKSTVLRLLDRKSSLSRKVAGTTSAEQLVASNIEAAFIVFSLKDETNLNRLERYLLLTRERNIYPIVILTKADLCTPEEAEAQVRAVTSIAPDLLVKSLCAKDPQRAKFLSDCLTGHKTGVLLGASGAGKSTLINALMGHEAQRVSTVRAGDQKGRHTTTSRRLVCLSNGGMIIDTPGIRELHLMESDESTQAEFAEIEALALQCRFSNCGHTAEPGCKILVALKAGSLENRRYQNYLKLLRERTAQSRNYKKT